MTFQIFQRDWMCSYNHGYAELLFDKLIEGSNSRARRIPDHETSGQMHHIASVCQELRRYILYVPAGTSPATRVTDNLNLLLGAVSAETSPALAQRPKTLPSAARLISATNDYSYSCHRWFILFHRLPDYPKLPLGIAKHCSATGSDTPPLPVENRTCLTSRCPICHGRTEITGRARYIYLALDILYAHSFADSVSISLRRRRIKSSSDCKASA